MSKALRELIDLLDLEVIEQGIFRGQSQELHLPQLFGGQVLGQTIQAASLTVSPDKAVHSVHGYFIRPGRACRPVLYEVRDLHDGRSFSTRQISASQDGKVIFTGAASFHIAEDGRSHQPRMEGVPEPEVLGLETDLLKGCESLASQVRLRAAAAEAIEIRPVDAIDPSSPTPQPPVKRFWFKAAGDVPDDPALHRSLLGYASDIGLLITSLLPHGVSDLQPDMQVASLDHGLWIHAPFRMDSWLLYSMESPWSGGARGLSRGQIFDRSGRLVASVAQEGLIRPR
ncbi:acyl-CoA thioesterase [Pseudomonas sp. NPDC089752]|uniref:acyl-CoA thioesterase n=1 Tax=Pseudomonas sp. NPDC089752 TaxID=3364472 RepID=UPI0038101977